MEREERNDSQGGYCGFRVRRMVWMLMRGWLIQVVQEGSKV
jgi:hypothetical protein